MRGLEAATCGNLSVLGALMMDTHAENHGGGFHTEPAIEQRCGYMKFGKFTIASTSAN
jgi:hypothetical protein